MAEVAELADALDSESSARKGVRVQIPPSAPVHILTTYNSVPSILAENAFSFITPFPSRRDMPSVFRGAF
jgi:hypothetical protein